LSFNSLAQGLVEDEKLFRRTLSKRKRRRDELTRLKSQLERKRELHASLFTKKNLDGLQRPFNPSLTNSETHYGRLISSTLSIALLPVKRKSAFGAQTKRYWRRLAKRI